MVWSAPMSKLPGTIAKMLCTAALTGAAMLAAAPVAAESFPSRAVTLIVPWPAGGAADAVLRALARATEPHLGQTIVVENKPGVAGTLGPAFMARTARPDGYTISQVTQTQFRLPHMQKVNFDPVKDFTYIIRLTGYTFGLVVNAKSPWQNIEEFLEYAKANPGKITYGSGGTGSSHHVAMEVLADEMDIEWQHVPYKGSSENLMALLGGHIDASSDSTGFAPYVEQGTMRLLVTYGAERAAKWPDVPTLDELVPGMVFDSPYGLAAPAGTPPGRVKILHDAFKKGLEDKQFQQTMSQYDQTPRYMNSEDYTQYNVQLFKDEQKLMNQLGLAQQ